MARTIANVVSKRKLPEEVQKKTRCYWPCPCGGTVPDAPEWCAYRKPAPCPGANTFCTPACICEFTCGDHFVCDAYKRYRKEVKAQRAADLAEAVAIREEMIKQGLIIEKKRAGS